MVAMKMRDVEKIWIADVMHYIFWQLIITRKDAPGCKEGRNKPWVAHDGDPTRANENASGIQNQKILR